MMISLLAVTLGAMIALAATLLAEIIRTRRERILVLSQLRYDSYLGFMLAVVRANDALHTISADDQDCTAHVATAMRDSGLYPARERLLVKPHPVVEDVEQVGAVDREEGGPLLEGGLGTRAEAVDADEQT